MKIILKFIFCFIFNFICVCFKIDKLYETNKKKLYFSSHKNIIKRHKIKSNIYNIIYCKYNDNNEKDIREEIEKENERREKVKAENNLFINSNFKYVSDYIPINVEKKYYYESFKYSEEIIAYIFFIINLFKHEQFKNKIYKENLKNEYSRKRNILQSDNFIFDKGNNIFERNKKLVDNFIDKFGDNFKFFNSHEKIQREDWANMFRLEQNDKNNFFKNIKIKNDKTKEYYFIIYYCNWKYECMALYNAFHNIFHNKYNSVNFFSIFDDKNKNEDKSKEKEQIDDLSKSDIEKIKEMYIKDLQNNEQMDIESLLKREQETNNNDNNEIKEVSSSENKSETKEDKNNNEKNEIKMSQDESKEKKNMTFQDIMEEEKKKLDEEFFLHGYSKYENIEEIKKEEELIKQTKKLIEEDKLNKTRLNNEIDFKNIYKNFYFHIKNYKDFYDYQHEKENTLMNYLDTCKNIKEKSQNINISNNKSNSNFNQMIEEVKKDEKKEVNINVIFVRLSNSTIIGKTKNIKKKVKKKWIYSQEKEIKFYELILSVMLNENIYYKNIPHMDIFSLSYDKGKLYDFFNSVNSNLKHCFIHKNNVYDIFNNVINDQMDIYNFNIYDTSKYKEEELVEDNNLKDELNVSNANKKEYIENDDIILEQLDPYHDIENMKDSQVIYEHIENNSDEYKGELENKIDDTNNLKGPEILKKKKKKNSNMQCKLMKKRHNKKERSKYEALFKQKYANIFVNNIRNKLNIERISSISNFDLHANYTIDIFKDFPLNDIFKNTNICENFKVDKNYVYYFNQKIPKELFPFILQLSLAFKYEHTTILLNAPKKVEFEFRNV